MRVRGGKADWQYRSGLAGAIGVAIAALLTTSGCAGSSGVPRGTPTTQTAQATGARTASPGPGVTNAPVSSAFASPTAKIAPRNPLTGPPADPFAGTPADHWGDGTAGIALPAARPIGTFTTAQVEFAYTTTRKLITAAYLDRSTLLGGRPTAFADLLISQERTWFAAGLTKTGVDKKGNELGTRDLVMSFAPGGTQLIGGVIKVHGTMRAKTAADDGNKVLDVDIDYLFVYAVQPPHDPTGWMRIVAQNSWTVMFGNWQGAATPFEPWVDFDNFSVAGAQCGTTDGYVHPDYPHTSGSGAQPTPSGTPVDPYALGGSAGPGCEATTGT
jgi:hypothetical protein